MCGLEDRPEDGYGGDDGGHPLDVRHPLAGGEGEGVLPPLVGHVNDRQLELLLLFHYLKNECLY